MKQTVALQKFSELDRRGIYVLTKGDMEKLFKNEHAKTLEKSLQRLVDAGVLQRACRGTYVYMLARSKKGMTIQDIASVLRRGHYSYVSLESALSEYGVISQIPMSRITLMTTGMSGLYETPYGTIEFTHTKRSVADLIRRTVSIKGRSLRYAKQSAALVDLVRVGRNTNMIAEADVE